MVYQFNIAFSYDLILTLVWFLKPYYWYSSDFMKIEFFFNGFATTSAQISDMKTSQVE